MYYGMNDGRSTRARSTGRTSDRDAVNLNGSTSSPRATSHPGHDHAVPAFTTDIAAMTGMFYNNGRIYYTVSKTGAANTTTNNMLYYRYFNPENDVSAPTIRRAAYPTDPTVQWGNVRGMTLASGKLIYASPTAGSTASAGTAPSRRARPQISSATTWQSRGMFVYNPPVGDNTPPTPPGKPSVKSLTAGKVNLSWGLQRRHPTDHVPHLQ